MQSALHLQQHQLTDLDFRVHEQYTTQEARAPCVLDFLDNVVDLPEDWSNLKVTVLQLVHSFAQSVLLNHRCFNVSVSVGISVDLERTSLSSSNVQINMNMCP